MTCQAYQAMIKYFNMVTVSYKMIGLYRDRVGLQLEVLHGLHCTMEPQ